ncbi:MAG: recombinase family protein [Oscillospiraceae bacterium]|nr:recombinase family protein [Oscillospiraceae bacterium]
MKIGYIRVSTQEQNTMRQEVLMQELSVDEVYIDRLSGKNTDRPELKKMMDYVRKGDTVIVESISRFARNTRDLLVLIEKLTEKGVEFVSRKEAIDTTTPTEKFMLTVFGAVAELEREYILQRQREGIAIAKAQGKYTGRKSIERSNFDAVEKLWRAGTISAAEAMRRLDFPGFSRVSRFAKNNNTFLHSLQQGGKAVRNNFRSWLIHSRRRKPL